ncbi:MAG: NADP-dependent phosphogluconate dehydrogenase [Pyrinomonadaceae bacterium]
MARPNTPLANIGLIGLGVMGQNLTLNIERNGYSVAVYDREPPVLERFFSAHPDKHIAAANSPEELVRSLERPRKIILLVKAGPPVDWTIDLVKPFLQKGDIIIDCGNSHFGDTEGRQNSLKADGLYLIGSGTSGGEKGALWGPSLMPGGDREAYEQIRPIWEAIAAKVADGPCVTYIGPGGAGHFVKMVHNGIEYGDMELIAEVYGVMRDAYRMHATEMADLFDEWNKGELESYLIEITAKILRVIDPQTNRPLVDLVLDEAEQKGTGKWTSQLALDLSVPIPTIDSSITARVISSRKDERKRLNESASGPGEVAVGDPSADIRDALRDALYAAKICSYAQGMTLIKAGSDSFNWSIDLSEVARIWQGGCIIRARFLGKIKEAYLRNPMLKNLLLDEDFNSRVDKAQKAWRMLIAMAISRGLPVLAITSSLGYFDMYRSANLPLNLTQAQRDFFGSHMYRRVDDATSKPVHTEWEELLKEQQH